MNAERDITLRISLNKQNQLEVSAEKAPLPTIIQLCYAAIEVSCRQSLKRADDPNLVKSLEEDMYEMINLGASSLLERLFPNIEARPDLTIDAMIKAEDELLATDGEKYAKAYAESAQSEKDIYEHNLAKANIALKEKESKMNRAQRRASK
jgi:hypothetical protein